MDINLTAPINELGYGVVGFNVLKSLAEAGDNVAYFPIGSPSVDQTHVPMVKRCIENQSNFNGDAPSVKIWHQHDLAQHVGKGKMVGFPIFELDRLTEREIHHLSNQDMVLVTSQWAKEVVARSVNRVVSVVPLGVDRSVFYDSDGDILDTTKFISIGKWEIRKGHDVIVEAFNKAFEDSDDVELLMMNHNPFLDEVREKEWHNLYLQSELGDKISILDRVQSHREVADIMRHADCGLFPSRAEGWNLEALEMMSCGKQVIVTNYSSHTEFCNSENSLLIEIDETEEAYDGIWFKGGGNWARLGTSQVDQLVEHMRSVHKNKCKNQAGILTAEKFSWENTAQALKVALQ